VATIRIGCELVLLAITRCQIGKSHDRLNTRFLRHACQGVDPLKMDQIEVKSYVGGLVKSFERKAA
jgi:hypothetical protein